MSTEEEVLQASEQFYAALDRFLNGDSEPMMEVWSHGPDVTAMHSAPGRQVGWEEVRAAWQQFASLTSGGQVTGHDLLVRVGGDLALHSRHRTHRGNPRLARKAAISLRSARDPPIVETRP